MYTVGELSRLSGVTVRTLHHYDDIGLLAPSGRSPAGYRQYDDGDLERLQEILFYRELGVGLDDIGGLFGSPVANRVEVLRQQKGLIRRRIRQLESMVGAIDSALTADEEGRVMDKQEMFEVFGDFDPTEHEEEARERWGGTDAYAQSGKRTAGYTKDDWKHIQAESEEIARRLAGLFGTGAAPDAADAVQAAEDHRVHIDRWFYPCSSEMHVGLGDMYVADPRFTKYWDGYATGLAPFVRDAFRANAARRGSG